MFRPIELLAEITTFAKIPNIKYMLAHTKLDNDLFMLKLFRGELKGTTENEDIFVHLKYFLRVTSL